MEVDTCTHGVSALQQACPCPSVETAPSTPVQPQTTRRSTSDAAPFEDAGSWNEGRTDLRLSVPCATGKGSTAAGPVPAQLQYRIALAASASANSIPSAFAPDLRESGLLVPSWQADTMVWVDLLPAWKGPPWFDSPKGWSLSFLLTTSHLSYIYLNEFSRVLYTAVLVALVTDSTAKEDAKTFDDTPTLTVEVMRRLF